MQALLDKAAATKAEYDKAASMLLARVQECQAKDSQIEKLTLANTRLQGLCRALRAGDAAAPAPADAAGCGDPPAPGAGDAAAGGAAVASAEAGAPEAGA